MAASRPTSPDRDYYQAVKQAHDGKIAAIAMARKLARRCYHTLRANGPRSGLRHALLNLNIPAGTDGRARPSSTSGSPRSAPVRRMHASHRAGRPYNTDATAAPTGGHPISIVVTDDTTLVADLGNAGRPYRRQQPAQTGPQREDFAPGQKGS